jgi:hypothetical protein
MIREDFTTGKLEDRDIILRFPICVILTPFMITRSRNMIYLYGMIMITTIMITRSRNIIDLYRVGCEKEQYKKFFFQDTSPEKEVMIFPKFFSHAIISEY